jgi:hypothetical protein
MTIVQKAALQSRVTTLHDLVQIRGERPPYGQDRRGCAVTWDTMDWRAAMNCSTAHAQWISAGHYVAVYRTYTAASQSRRDAKGEPVRYRTPEHAECAAWRALKAAEDRIEAIRFDPAQIKRSPKFWETVRNPKSRAGRKALFDSIFKEGEGMMPKAELRYIHRR